MKLLSALAWAAHIVLFSEAGFASLQDYPLQFQVRREGLISEIVARNDGPSTMSAHLTLSGTNVASDKVWPIDVTLQRYSSQVIARVWPLAPDGSMKFSYSSTHHFGDAQSRHSSNARYRLPFEDGKTFPVAQTYGGVLTTHDDKESQYAVDFTMPEGTVVVAARAGVVVDVTIGHSAGGRDAALLDKANSVVVLHDDGTIAEYAHLAQRAAMVSRGQRVEVGDQLAFSGNTGYSSGPHLHFAVSRPALSDSGSMRQVALPIIFYTHNPPTPLVPRQGESVSSTYDRAWDSFEPGQFTSARNWKETKAASNNAVVMGSVDGAEPSGVKGGATESNVTIVRRHLAIERAGLPTWIWIMGLLLIWLFVRTRRKSIDLSRQFDLPEPTIYGTFDPENSVGGRILDQKVPKNDRR